MNLDVFLLPVPLPVRKLAPEVSSRAYISKFCYVDNSKNRGAKTNHGQSVVNRPHHCPLTSF